MENKTSSSVKIRRIAVMAMLAAISFAVLLLAHLVPFFSFIPALPFLKYDPKDVIIVMGGFLLGPLEALAISVVVSLIEMLTISTTGPIGLLMNVLSTAAFACTAAVVYRKKHDMGGAILGLALGVVCMTVVMLLWNWLITPLYMHVPRAVIVTYMLPGFLPFNLVKAAANMALTLLLYKPISKALRNAHLLPPSKGGSGSGKFSAGLIIFSVVLLISCVLVALALLGLLGG